MLIFLGYYIDEIVIDTKTMFLFAWESFWIVLHQKWVSSIVMNHYIFSSIKEANWFISKGMCVLLFDVFSGCSLVKK